VFGKGENYFPEKLFFMENDFPKKIIFHLHFLLFGRMKNYFFKKSFSTVW